MHVDHHFNASTRGSSFNARFAQGRHFWLKGLSHWDSATLQPAPPMEQRFTQGPLPLGLGHLAACSSDGATLRSRAFSTGTRPPCSLLLRWSNAALKGLFHWDSATL
ncbi:hypothetical protein Adt_30483 [Abeliophyllum distichum]|uniref:Uncharacterized protein n=1 Tax=Abeliophyllum distichum TaxID=126358 RepID=A0ABD1RBE8_9LAMI